MLLNGATSSNNMPLTNDILYKNPVYDLICAPMRTQMLTEVRQVSKFGNSMHMAVQPMSPSQHQAQVVLSKCGCRVSSWVLSDTKLTQVQNYCAVNLSSMCSDERCILKTVMNWLQLHRAKLQFSLCSTTLLYVTPARYEPFKRCDGQKHTNQLNSHKY